MSARRQTPEPPRAEELEPFIIAIPRHCASERIITRQQVLLGLQFAVELAGPYFAACERAHLVEPPGFARPLHRAYHAWPARHKYASLSFVLGDAATPFTLMLLMWGGNKHHSIWALFREAMIPVLLDASICQPRTAGFEKLRKLCVGRLGFDFSADPVLARLIVGNARLRQHACAGFLADGLLPWDLPTCLEQQDFQSAVRVLYTECPDAVGAFLNNPRLRSEELGQAFSLVNTPRTVEWLRLQAIESVLRHPVRISVIPITCFGPSRSVVSLHVDHLVRSMSIRGDVGPQTRG